MFTIEFEKIPLEAFAELPPELRSEAFFRANELTNAYVDARAAGLAEALGRDPEVAADRRGAWEWIRRKLDGRPTPLRDAASLRASILREFPSLLATLDIIDAAVDAYPAFLRGEVDGGAVLFDPAFPDRWDRYFTNENPVYGAGNTLAAHAAAEALRDRSPGRRLRVLEVGAGCGSAAEALIARLESSISSYVLTDISPGFLRKARERLNAGSPVAGMDLAFRWMDLNRAPEAWPAGVGEHDLIHAVNVLHAVHDLDASLRGLRRLLAPGGVLVLGECVRPARGRPVHPEIVFQLLDEFRRPVLDPETRPEPGFLDAPSWRASLARAGFTRVRFLPDFERAVAAYPEHSLAAIIARAD